MTEREIEKTAEIFEKICHVLSYFVVGGFLHIVLRFAEAWEKGLLP